MPMLVKGELVLPPRIDARRLNSWWRPTGRAARRAERLAVEGAYLVRRPVLDRSTLEPTGEAQVVAFPLVEPDRLVEEDPTEMARTLHRLPFDEVLDYVRALREVLASKRGLLEALTARAKATSLVHGSLVELVGNVLQGLLDPDGLAAAVDRDLGGPDAPGRRYLDEWVPVSARAHRGLTARLSEEIFDTGGSSTGVGEALRLRAVPTRQLHITAGNSAIVPFVSALRAFATKGAAVVKSPSESFLASVVLAVAMHEVDAGHPLTRHTSLVCWPGGDARVENGLFRRNSFDRLVVWGSAETVKSVRLRAPDVRTIIMEPRVGVSLIGREAIAAGARGAAVRAAADSMVENQQACTSSLVHYVEGPEEVALDYCRALQEVLARWDVAIPHAPSRESVARQRQLRRGELALATWFVNGRSPATSAVVYVRTRFDLATHPLGRCIVVRRVDDLREAVSLLDRGISTAGVATEARREQLRDEIAARGVSNVLPLGEAELAYAGMPHDGMRVLSELVSWTTA